MRHATRRFTSPDGTSRFLREFGIARLASIHAQSPRPCECCAALGRKPSDGEPAYPRRYVCTTRHFGLQDEEGRELIDLTHVCVRRWAPTVGRCGLAPTLAAREIRLRSGTG